MTMPAPIPFIDLQAQRRRIAAEVDAAIAKVHEHGRYILGPEVAEAERALEAFTGSRHCTGVSNGTDGLLAALLAFGVGPGDAVLTTPFTFFASSECIAMLGATPVFADIDPDTYNLDPASVRAAIAQAGADGHNLKGIITVDLFGLPADYDALLPVARENSLFVIQDAAQGFGALYHDRRVPVHGDIGVTSFFPAKPLGCYGDGGAVFTDDAGIHEKLVSIRMHGQGSDQYDNVRVGMNARLDTLQAAILLEKLKIYPGEIDLRNRAAKRYTEQLEAVNGKAGSELFKLPVVPDGCVSVWAQYTIQAGDRERYQNALKAENIPSAVYYRQPSHLVGAFSHLGHKPGDFPVAEAAATRVFSLPFHPYLEDGQIERICAVLEREALK